MLKVALVTGGGKRRIGWHVDPIARRARLCRGGSLSHVCRRGGRNRRRSPNPAGVEAIAVEGGSGVRK